MVAIAATADTAGAFVRLDVSSLGSATVSSIVASPVNRDDYTVRGPYVVSGSTVVARDGAAPLGRAIVYTVTLSDGSQATSSAVTITIGTPALSDATDPTRVEFPTVVRQRPNAREGRSQAWPILGQSLPFVTFAPMGPQTGELVVRAEDVYARNALIGLLERGRPMILRSPVDHVDDLTFVVEALEDGLANDDDHDGAATLRLRYRAVSPSLGSTSGDPSRTWQTIETLHDEWFDLLQNYATWADVLTGAPDVNLSAEKLVASGSFAAGLTGWSTFWTTASWVAWSAPSGYVRSTGRAATTTSGASIGDLEDTAMAHPITPGTVVRVTGRVRRSAGFAQAEVALITNTDPGVPTYFTPGGAIVTAPIAITADNEWTPFRADLTVPSGDDVYAIHFRAIHNTVYSSTIDWDDLSVRWLT